MAILNENSLDYTLENAKQFVNKIQEANKLLKARKYKSAVTFLQASKPYCITAKSHYGNSLYFKALAGLCLNIQKKYRCEQACNITYRSLIEARKKISEGGEDDEIEFYFWFYVEPSRIELWQDIIRYYLCLGKPAKALYSLKQLDIEIQELSEFSPSQTAIDKLKITFQPFKIVFTAWGYNQLGNYQKGLDLLQSRNFYVIGFGEDIKTFIELLKICHEYQESDSPSKYLMESFLEEFQNNQEQISLKIKEQQQTFVESLKKNDFQIFINGLEKHKAYFSSIFSNLRKVVNEELLPSGSFDRLEKDKISIPPLAIITFWQTGVSLLNLGEQDKGRYLINSLKSVLAEDENKFSLNDAFERELVSLIQKS